MYHLQFGLTFCSSTTITQKYRIWEWLAKNKPIRPANTQWAVIMAATVTVRARNGGPFRSRCSNWWVRADRVPCEVFLCTNYFVSMYSLSHVLASDWSTIRPTIVERRFSSALERSDWRMWHSDRWQFWPGFMCWAKWSGTREWIVNRRISWAIYNDHDVHFV